MVAIGEMAPKFLGVTDGGGVVALKDLSGKKVILYFYPKDMTPGCTTEAENFRDEADQFERIDAIIIGVSKDSVRRHENFKEKHNLPFSLISDVSGEICEAYGVWKKKKNYGREYMGIVRSTFLIDDGGKIARIWHKVRVKGHVAEVLEATRAL